MSMKKTVALCVITAIVTLAITQFSAAPAPAEGKDKALVYELRTYTCLPGRLPNLHARFADHTMRIFEKHGMKNIIYWTPQDAKRKDNTLVYVIAHKSRAAADASWKAFVADPEWKKVQRVSEEDGKILTKVERTYLSPTKYSPMK